MASWGNRRKYGIALVFFILIIIPVLLLAYKIFYQAPSCTDNRQNQGELGKDCGGPCALYCRGTTAEPVILWARVFKVTYGVYTAAISIQNPNLNAKAKDVPYRMRVLDVDGVMVYERYGKVDINPKYTFPIIEPGIQLGERKPSRVTFEFIADPVWYREEAKVIPVTISNDVIYNEATSPQIVARLDNSTVKEVKKVGVGVIVYGSDGNAMAVSRTIVDVVPATGHAQAVFTWPEPFPMPILRKEIVILE